MSSFTHESEILEKEQKKILQEEKKIEQETKKILTFSSYIRNILKKDLQNGTKNEDMAGGETTFLQRFVIDKAKKHRILFPFVILSAVVLVWRGLWGIFDETPIISSSYISLIAGILILLLFNKITEL